MRILKLFCGNCGILCEIVIFCIYLSMFLQCFRSGIDVGYYDVFNERNSNWLIYVRPASTRHEINVIVYLQDDDIFFCTAKVGAVNRCLPTSFSQWLIALIDYSYKIYASSSCEWYLNTVYDFYLTSTFRPSRLMRNCERGTRRTLLTSWACLTCQKV